MAMHKDYPIGTRYGMVRLTPTEATHIFVGNDVAGLGDNPMVVNNSSLATVSAHYFLWDDGKWHLGLKGETPSQTYNQMYAKKSPLRDGASDSQRRKLIEEFDRVVNEWAAANPKAIFEAHIADLERRKENAQQAVQEAEENLRQKQETLNLVYNQLHAALGNSDTPTAA